MKRLLEKPRFGLASPAGWSFGIGLLSLFLGIPLMPKFPSGWALPFIALGGAFLIIGMGSWQEKRWAAVAGVWVMGLVAGWRAVGLVSEFSWSKLVMVFLYGLIAWEFWSALRQWRESVEKEESAGSPDADGEKPMISIVLLLTGPRYLEEAILARTVEDAWGGVYTDGDDESADGFVVGQTPVYMVKSPHGFFMVHNHEGPYFTELEELAESIRELRLRKAVLEHGGWLSVDLVTPFDNSLPVEEYYAPIIRLVYELAGDDVLAVFRPETGQINLWSDDVLEVLLRPRGFDEFNRVRTNPEVVPVAANDAAMVAATIMARERWGDFVTAFQSRSARDRFGVKAPVSIGEVTEYIWIEVTGLEKEYIHGELGNDPVALDGLKLGDRVEVPVADVNDWYYSIGDTAPVGLFTLEAVSKAQERKK